MSTPAIRAALERLIELDKGIQGISGIPVDDWTDATAAARAALAQSEGGGAPDSPAEFLAARPLLEQLARLNDSVGITVAEVRQLAAQAAAWLRKNSPGQPVAIEPRGCPTPGACSCVVPATSPAPEYAGGSINDDQREAVRAAVTEALGGAYDCTRVWEAWQVGTMGPDDFVLVAEDDDRVAEIADAAIEAICPTAPPAPEVLEA
jgi:hypothetical protein